MSGRKDGAEGENRPESVAATLGCFLAGTRSLPGPLRHQGRRAILNGVATALGSARDEPVKQAASVMQELGGAGIATVLGRPERLRPAEAAFVNAIAMNLLDFDDTHLPTIIHPTSPVAPVALALGEQLGSGGAEVLAAFVLGAEIACRIGNMVSPGHYARGWHITSTCGTFGAAAAAARLMRLDGVRSAHALGIASSLAAGNIENLPSAGKNASVGVAARNGILAAHLARAGYEAAPTAIEGPLGWARACGDVPDVEAGLRELGRSWEFALDAFKPYPCGIVFHAVIDACLALRERHAMDPGLIEEVVVKGDALLLARGDRAVGNARDARVSLHHAAAIGLLRGAAGMREFEADCVEAPEIVAFRAKVRGEIDPGLPPGAATVEARLKDGRTVSWTVLHARGSAERPLSDADLESKARMAVAAGGTGCDAERIIEALWRLDDVADIGPLMRTTRPPGATVL
ncbi:MmgE/PrpD family protein [Enterovirga aerilata]|uniref:MmgE/PrpD family protein n=1 Tax=Enterovirga aerilata TaxID=2730920 RepID=A0A849I6J9_9HYPH|nr:MmgE/PrpD family protein [Enterovirga sp. DB1703]NNM72931.1 MmgE/PrpD family protein [Enterovirga sp. DB1703]